MTFMNTPNKAGVISAVMGTRNSGLDGGGISTSVLSVRTYIVLEQ